ncbi:MAG: HlyD family type I secretion periplasmic adaptor subunit, partial [Hyphomicrobiales bacterium]|nr:HlyD family type I secretion periplasmic adaptor subunit [Hyphomicrobiales bacterium]
IREEIAGLKSQRTATQAQLVFIGDELKGQQKLFDKGLSQITKLLALKRAKAKLDGENGKLIADIGRAKVRLTETEARIVHLKSQRKKEAIEEMRKVNRELADVAERIKAARDVLARVEIRSPVNGAVVKLLHHTRGGVVSPGQQILELLPMEDELLVEAFIRPIDIDVVKKGDRAQLRLTAFNQRVTPTVVGRVIYVSADAIESKTAGQFFYVSRIRVDKADVKKIADLKPAPGMPVEVYINTGERTFFEYLLKPISDSFSRAFRED